MSILEEKSQDRLQKICDTLTHQTLEPAKQQAEKLLAEAHEKVQEIISQAEQEKKMILESAEQELSKQKSIYENSLVQAGRQALEILRQSIEQDFFNKHFSKMISQTANEPTLLSDIIKTLLEVVKSQGWEGDISAKVAKSVDSQKICALLGDELLRAVKDSSLTLGNFDGGAQLKLEDKHLTLDLSDKALKDLLAKFLRKDFRQFLFHG